MRRVLYLYSGSRKGKFKGTPGVDYPDTQFYGQNHLRTFGISADYKEWSDVPLNRFWSFRMKHLLLYPFTRGYDVVFGSSLLYLMPLKMLFRSKATFVLLNIGIMRTLAAHRTHRLRSWLLRSLMEGFEAVVCLSTHQKEQLEREYPALIGKTFFVPLGVDTRFYQPNYENRQSYILSAGRDNGRDYASVIETARLMPEREFHIVCSPRNLKGIRDFPSNVKVFYDVPFAELHRKYQEASLLLLLTRTSHAGSDCSGQTVLLDAMANGLPIVVNDQPYLADYVTDGKEAVVIQSTDPQAAKIAIESLDAVELREIAMRARARVEKGYSTEHMARELAAVFTRVAPIHGKSAEDHRG